MRPIMKQQILSLHVLLGRLCKVSVEREDNFPCGRSDFYAVVTVPWAEKTTGDEKAIRLLRVPIPPPSIHWEE
jgi:hypothetical protein